MRSEKILLKNIIDSLKNLEIQKRISLSEWAGEYRYLSTEDSAESGKWDNTRAPFQVEIMDACSDPMIEKMVVVASSQIGKTQMMNNYIGYLIHLNPQPIMYVHFSEKMAESWSRDRLTPMIRDCEVLEGRVNIGSKKTGDTILYKAFKGGSLTMIGANSAGSLSSRPISKLILDEVDRYPLSSGGEGSPIELATARTKTFSQRKIVLISSPSDEDTSRIWSEYLLSTMGEFNVPCPHCNEYLTFDFKNLSKNEFGVHYQCPHCSEYFDETKKYDMLQSGKWIHQFPERKVKGFWINEMYSPWSTWEGMMERYEKAMVRAKAGDFSDLKVFINTALAEVYSESLTADYSPDLLKSRIEEHYDEIGTAITIGIDVQDNRLEASAWAYDADEQSWLLEHRVFYGNAGIDSTWTQLEEWMNTMDYDAAAIDCGGHFTDWAYKFAKKWQHKRVYAIRGSNNPSAPLLPKKPSMNNSAHIPVYFVGTQAVKDIIYARIKIEQKGAGYIHLNKFADTEWIDQLLAEKKVIKPNGTKTYEKVRDRNEALDCYAYSIFAVRNLRPNYDKLKLYKERKVHDNAPVEQPVVQPTIPQRHRQTPFATRWKL